MLSPLTLRSDLARMLRDPEFILTYLDSQRAYGIILFELLIGETFLKLMIQILYSLIIGIVLINL